MTHRRTLTCPGVRLVCPNPRCGRTVSLFDLRDGYGFATCSHKRGGENCGQHLYFACDQRLCTVVAVSRAEYDRLRDGHPTRAEIEAELGIATQDAAA